MAGFETPEQKAAREAREAMQQQTGGYVAPGNAPLPPGYDRSSMTPEAQQARREQGRAQAAANVATGNQLPGKFSTWGGQAKQDIVHSELSRGEADAKRQRDFGFGAGNNAETAGMIGGVQQTADKFSTVFGDMAGTAGARSDAANARGTGMYAGDMGQYQTGLANAQQARGMQTGAYDALMGMANAGPGPSAAQAQLTQATDANTQNALAMARSGRGMGGGAAAMRQAIGQNAATQQQAGGQMAQLRANENTAFQAQRLQAMQGAGDVGYKTAATDQNYGQLGLQGAQYETDTLLKGTDLNDRTAAGWADRQLTGAERAHGAEVTGHNQVQNLNAAALAARQAEDDAAFRKAALERGEVAAAEQRQANLVDATISGGATVAGAVSDERGKMIIEPLGGIASTRPGEPLSGNGVKPIQIQPKLPPPPPPPGPSEEEEAAAKGGKIGGTVGKVGGAVIGGVVGGPIGALAGSAIGGLAGKHLGKIFSDVRSKTNIEPLSSSTDEADPYAQLGSLAEKYGAAGVASTPKAVNEYTALKPGEEKGFQSWLKKNNVNDLDHPDSHYDYRGAYRAGEGRGPGRSGHFTDQFKQHGHETFSTESQYSKGGKDGGSWVGDTYLPEAAQDRGSRTERRFARDESHPILSEGDALLADSARNAPPSAYDYKEPDAPGAKPGRQIGPMAQDLAAHPVTRGAVETDPNTGRLMVDGGRAALAGLAQNHSQQNQLDALGGEIARLEGLLKRKPGDSRATGFKRDQTAGGLN